MNIYDVVTQRRKAFRDMFVALKDFAEPTEREKMATEHAINMREMAQRAKLDLETDMMKSTQGFVEQMKLNDIEYDRDIEQLGLSMHAQLTRDNQLHNNALELEKLRVTNDKTSAKLLRDQTKTDLVEAENKVRNDAFIAYSGASGTRNAAGWEAYHQQLSKATLSDDLKKRDFQIPDPSVRTFFAEVGTGAWKGGASLVTTGILGGPMTGAAAALVGGIGGGAKGAYDYTIGKSDMSNLEPAFGWVAKGSSDIAHTGLFEKGDYRELEKKLRAKKQEDDSTVMFSDEDIEDMISRMAYQDYDGTIAFEMWYPEGVETADGMQYTLGGLGLAINANYQEDYSHMFPWMGSKEEQEAKKDTVKLKMPRKMLSEKNSAMYGNYRLIEHVLENSLSDKTIALVGIQLGPEAENLLKRKQYEMHAKKKHYEDYSTQNDSAIRNGGVVDLSDHEYIISKANTTVTTIGQ